MGKVQAACPDSRQPGGLALSHSSHRTRIPSPGTLPPSTSCLDVRLACGRSGYLVARQARGFPWPRPTGPEKAGVWIRASLLPVGQPLQKELEELEGGFMTQPHRREQLPLDLPLPSPLVTAAASISEGIGSQGPSSLLRTDTSHGQGPASRLHFPHGETGLLRGSLGPGLPPALLPTSSGLLPLSGPGSWQVRSNTLDAQMPAQSWP